MVATSRPYLAVAGEGSPHVLAAPAAIPFAEGVQPRSYRPDVAARTTTCTYDPLYRLTAADYSTGEFFHYIYDAVGNRLTQVTEAETNTYTYDIANRLTSVDGVPFTWDANGNLISDGVSTYSYDPANRLRVVDQGDTSYTFLYDGLGNRVAQIVAGGTSYDYALDLAAGLTQVLSDGTNAYLHGRARIGEKQTGGWQYHLGDALGSVRELTGSTGMVGLAQSFAPFGSVMSSVGSASTALAFTGEQLDGTGLVCTVQVWRQLRAECIFYGRERERSRAGAGQGQAARPEAHARAAGDEVEAVATDGPTSPEGSRCIAP